MAKNLVTRNTESDLRIAYLLAFDDFSTGPVEVGNAVGGNSRYGRELLGTLVNSGLVTETLVNGTDTAWQCWDTYDSITRDEAITKFEAWLDSQAPEASKAAKAPTNLIECLCGCGELANKGRLYRPGHDARHAGQVARFAATRDAEERSPLLGALPTPALRMKAADMVERLLAKPAKAPRRASKAVKAVEPVTEAGTVKKGRWTYPALKTNGVVYISRSRKNTGEWDEATDAKVIASFTR